MEITSFLHLAVRCIMIASIILLIIGCVYFIWYFIQKKRKKDVYLNKKKLIFSALLIGYIIVVVFATLLMERKAVLIEANLVPFSSYISAWNSFGMFLWRNIILNICMFIPLGMILPLFHRVFKKWWCTYSVGLLLTILIEVSQYISKRGIFEVDDIINNTLGCMIGYGIWQLGYFIYCKLRKQDNKLLPTLLKQIPLVLTVGIFSMIFIIYYQKDLGNIRQDYYQINDMSNINLVNQAKLSSKITDKYVYKIKEYNKEECYFFAKHFFDKINLEIDQQNIEEYDETIVYHSKDNKTNMRIDYSRGSFIFNNSFDQNNYQEGLSLKQITDLLASYGIVVNEQSIFSDLGSGQYEIKYDDLFIDNNYVTGTINCFVTADLKFKSIEYNIRTYEPYKKYQLISTKEAYKRIEEGKFNKDYLENVQDEITIRLVRLNYLRDTKGLLQPVYEFVTNGNGIIYVPAIR